MAGKLFCSLMVACALTPLSSTARAAPDCQNLEGTWKNPQGRILTVEKFNAKTSQISGTYQFPPAIDPNKYQLVGWVNSEGKKAQAGDTAVSFSVQWGELTSISSWLGTCSLPAHGKPQLNLLWQQVRLNAQPKNERMTTGADVFSPE